MKLTSNLPFLIALDLLFATSHAAAIEFKSTSLETGSGTSPNPRAVDVHFPFGFPFPSLVGLEGITSFDCEYNCAPGKPSAPKCICPFQPLATCCYAYGCDLCSVPVPYKPVDPNDSKQPDLAGTPPPAQSPAVVAPPDPNDPDNCKACVHYGLGCSVRSRLYCPRMMCSGGDSAVPAQCRLGGKCQKVSKESNYYWCQSSVNLPKRFINATEPANDTAPPIDLEDGSDDGPAIGPAMGLGGPLFIPAPDPRSSSKTSPSPTPTSIPKPPPPVSTTPPTAIPTQSSECKACNEELVKCGYQAGCNLQPDLPYCLDGCKRYVCNYQRPMCRDTCFRDDCTRLNAVWRGGEYEGF